MNTNSPVRKMRSKFTANVSTLKNNQSLRYELYEAGSPLSYGHFLTHLQTNQSFRSFFIDVLQEIPLKAYHWETPPVTSSNVDQPFEFVVSTAPGIDLPPDYTPFEQYFQSLREVAVFNNLGNDAKLIAPYPLKKGQNYAHIGIFTKTAPEKKQHALWQKVGEITKQALSEEPLWLNTAGGGVAWLHVRLDSRPKYYQHVPYRSTGHS